MVYISVFFMMFIAMLIRDTLWSFATSLIAKGEWLRAACMNSLGDGFGYVMVFLVASAAVNSFSATALVQGLGEMGGAFAGVICGRMVSLIMDHSFTWYNVRKSLTW